MSVNLTGIAGILGSTEAEVTNKLDRLLQMMQIRGAFRKTMSVRGNETFLAIGLCIHNREETLAENPEKTSTVFDGVLPSSLELDEIGDSANEPVGTSGQFTESEPRM